MYLLNVKIMNYFKKTLIIIYFWCGIGIEMSVTCTMLYVIICVIVIDDSFHSTVYYKCKCMQLHVLIFWKTPKKITSTGIHYYICFSLASYNVHVHVPVAMATL